MNALGQVGVNLEVEADYIMNRFYNNAVKGGRGFAMPNGAFPGPAVDANGWPTAAWSLVMSSKNGNCPPGVYKGRYFGAAAMVTASAGATITNTSYSGGFQNFDMTVPAYVLGLGTAILQGSGAVTLLEIVRPGVGLPGTAYPTFNAPALQYLISVNSIRFMKPLAVEAGAGSPNGAEIPGGGWTTRNTPTTTQTGFGGVGMPHEYVIEFCNTLAALPGSNLKSVWTNMFYTVDDNYVTQMATLYKSTLNPALKLYVEYGNENWNSSYQAVFYGMIKGAMLDVDGAYGDSGYGYANRFVSISSNGVTATIIFTGAHNRTTGNNIFFSNGGTWNYSGPCIVLNATTLTFPMAVSGSVSITSKCVYIGLPNTGVSYDGASNINLLLRRYQIKQVWRCGLLIEAVYGSSIGNSTPAAIMVCGQQQQDGTKPSGFAEATYKYVEDTFTTRAMKTVIGLIALHPYPDQALPNAAASIQDYIDLTAASITGRNRNELAAFQNLNTTYGVPMGAYEWGPSFLSNGHLGRTDLEVATSRDSRMTGLVLLAYSTYNSLGMGIQQYFHGSAIDDYNNPPTSASNPDSDPNANNGNENWFTNGDPSIPWATNTPKTMAVYQALNLVPVLGDAQCLVPALTIGQKATIPATIIPNAFPTPNYGRQDKNTPGNNVGWTVCNNSGLGGYGNLGYNRVASHAVAGARWVEFSILFLKAGAHTVNLWAFCGNQAGTPENLTLTLDGNAFCTYPLPGLSGGGDFLNFACTANSEVAVTVPSAGFHVLRVLVPDTTTSAGQFALLKTVFTKT